MTKMTTITMALLGTLLLPLACHAFVTTTTTLPSFLPSSSSLCTIDSFKNNNNVVMSTTSSSMIQQQQQQSTSVIGQKNNKRAMMGWRSRTKRRKQKNRKEEEEENNNNFVGPRRLFFKLPPLPNDKITLSCDLLAIYIYSILDHARFEQPFLTSLSFSSPSTTTYAPLLQHSTCAAFIMGACWLCGGYLLQAFQSENTMECPTWHMLAVTGKSWLISAFLLVILALGSDWFMTTIVATTTTTTMTHFGPIADTIWFSDSSTSLTQYGLTNDDCAYIFDSLSVLISWRFVVNVIMGGLSRE